MKITFKKIPKLAISFYLIGIVCLCSAMLLFYYFPQVLPTVHVQQLFIFGAIVVALGSVVNTFFQFK
ncbi:MAG: hypothetical protein OEY19_07740 [Gammaproteobacteria bacterium]|nr:hypothetical protein [Gammaproteobacteria bacterium]MDH5630155.1 hypothetical protein [Gammaproteobacteria bacterium]